MENHGDGKGAGRDRRSGAEALRTLAALIVVIAGLRLGSEFLNPLLLAGFFALAVSPVHERLRGAGFPVWLAVTTSLVAALALVVGIGALAAQSLPAVAERMALYGERIEAIADDAVGWLGSAGLPLPTEAAELGLDPQALLAFVTDVLGSVGDTVSDAVVILLVVLFMVAQVGAPSAGPRELRSGRSAGARIARSVTDYLSVKTLISLCTGIAWGVLLAVVGVDFPVLWGLVAFLFNYVPTIGSVIATLPPICLALVQFGLGHALVVAGGAIVVNGVLGNVVEPKLMGHRLGLSALAVFVALIFWSWVLGPVGALLSVPLTIAVKIGLESAADYAPLAALLGPAPRAETPGSAPGPS